MEELGFMSPRTTYTDVKMKDFLNNEIKGDIYFKKNFQKSLLSIMVSEKGLLLRLMNYRDGQELLIMVESKEIEVFYASKSFK